MNPTSFEKRKIRILLLEGIHPTAVETLHRHGYETVDLLPGALGEDELRKRVRGVHFIGIRSRTLLTESVFAAADKLLAVGCFCIGTNQVDLDAALVRGIPVFNAPYSNTRSVAELVIGQIILLLRGIPEKNALAHRGIWQKSASGAYETRGKRLGIIGYGNIGSQLSVLAESMGLQVSYYDIMTKLPLGNAHQVDSLKTLLKDSDVVSLHVPQTPQTANLIGARQLSWMKPGAILINASRGNVVDIDALAAALEKRHLAGAAIDVFPSEPGTNDEEFVSPLRRFDNCILTPHIGGSTMEAQANIGVEVAEKLARYSDNGSTFTAVNFPEVALPAHPGKHRLLHIHNNVPGVMSEINGIFSDIGINISAQFLQTNDKVGYVVMDIDEKYSRVALERLNRVAGTVRCRVLF